MSARQLAVNVFLKGFDTLSGPLRAIAGTSMDTKAKVRALSDDVRAQKGALADLRDEMKKAGGGTDDMIAREKRLSDQLARTTKQLDLQKAAQKRLEQARTDADKGHNAGMKNLAVGAGLAAPLILAGKAASDFQEGMTDIRQKADLSAEATDRMQTGILSAARAAGQLPENMRAGVDFLAGAGLDTDRALKMMTPIGRAATAYNAQIEDLSRASFSAVDNLKVPFDQTAKAIDIMAKAGKDGNFELQDMAMYFPQLTASAQGLGQKGVGAVADLAAALEIARKGAGDSATAANNVQNLLAKINSNETEKNFKSFGINLPAALKKAYAEGKTPLEAIAELTEKATKGDLSKIPKLFNDMQVQNALRPLIQNMDEFRRIRADALNASGTVDADFGIRQQNAAAQARILAGDAQHLAIVLGDQLLPKVNAIVGPVVHLADDFNKWSDTHKTAAGTLATVVTGIAGFNLVLGAGRIAWAATVVPLTKLYNGFILLKNSAIVAQVWAGASAIMGPAMSAMRVGMIAGAQGVWAFTVALLANPITWIVVAIVAAVGLLAFGVYELIKHWDKVGPWLSNLWHNIQSIFMTGVQWAMNAFLNFTPLGWLIQAINPALNWLRQIDMLGIGKHLIDGLIGGITAKWNELKSTIKAVADGAANWFKNHLGIHSPSRVFMDFGRNIADGLSMGISRGMSGPVGQVSRMAEGVRGAMTPPVRRLASTVTGMMQEPAPTFRRMTRVAGAAATVGMAAMGAGTAPSIYIAPGAIVINAAPNHSAQDIATAVRDAIAGHVAEQDARKRSSYRDDDA